MWLDKVVNMMGKDLLKNEEYDEVLNKDKEALIIEADINVLEDEEQ